MLFFRSKGYRVIAHDRRGHGLEWAQCSGAWIVEDDYLSELQLLGRAVPCLASTDTAGRVVHVGSFSKTLSPALRLGFIVVPRVLAERFGDAAACLAPAPDPTSQQALSDFIEQAATPALLLGITNLDVRTLNSDCDRILHHINGHRDRGAPSVGSTQAGFS